MSCRVMKIESLAELASYMAALMNLGFDFFQHSAPAALFETTRDCRKSYFCSSRKLYEKLYSLNVAAFNGRYKEDDTTAAPDVDIDKYSTYERLTFEDFPPQVATWHYRIAKLLDCWLYQTDEDATHADDFRMAVAELRRVLVDFIVSNSAAYKAIEWGEI